MSETAIPPPAAPPAKSKTKDAFNIYMKHTTAATIAKHMDGVICRSRGDVVDSAFEALSAAKWKPGMKLRAIFSETKSR